MTIADDRWLDETTKRGEAILFLSKLGVAMDRLRAMSDDTLLTTYDIAVRQERRTNPMPTPDGDGDCRAEQGTHRACDECGAMIEIATRKGHKDDCPYVMCETDSPETEPCDPEPERRFVLVSRIFNGHEVWENMAEPDADYDNEVPVIRGTWKVYTEVVVGRLALQKAIDDCYEMQADNPPYDNAYPVIAFDEETKEMVWIPEERR